MNESVEDPVGQLRITTVQRGMPRFDGQLADHLRRARLAAVIDHLGQILGFDHVGWREQKDVEHQKTNSAELPNTAHIAAVSAAER